MRRPPATDERRTAPENCKEGESRNSWRPRFTPCTVNVVRWQHAATTHSPTRYVCHSLKGQGQLCNTIRCASTGTKPLEGCWPALLTVQATRLQNTCTHTAATRKWIELHRDTQHRDENWHCGAQGCRAGFLQLGRLESPKGTETPFPLWGNARRAGEPSC